MAETRGPPPADQAMHRQLGEETGPPQRDTRATQRAERRTGPERGEDPASGSVESPVAPGEAQAGDLNEAGGNLGGPVDVFPGRGRPQKERPPG